MKRIAIIGAGAAGCFAAANIPRSKEQEVVIFEKTGKSLQKVKVSGGGRCNVTHACFEIPELVKRYPRGSTLLKKSLHHFSPRETIQWFADRGVRIKTEDDGRMFPVTDSSQTIIDCLLNAVENAGATIRYHYALKDMELKDRFILHFDNGEQYEADKLLLSAGSILKPENYRWLQSLGHTILAPAPSLFTFNIPGNPITQLMGISVENAIVKIEGTKITQQGPLLITHWGFSGPAVLRSSAWGARVLQDKQYHFTSIINWLGEHNVETMREEMAMMRQSIGKNLVISKNPFGLPRRLWEHIAYRSGVTETMRWAEMSASVQKALIQSLVEDRYEVRGKTTYKEEFVICGGISISEINARTMESKLVPGLYFAGEFMDVDGVTGGFNFQHAWCSAYLAARAMQDTI